MISATAIISNIGTCYAAQPYDQILSIIGDTNQTIELYPDYTTYFSGISPSQQAVIHANSKSLSATEATVAAAQAYIR
ncbi:hypothetical protein CTAM01_07875 [Colletotrichum tamarilloi]|uniref:Uncharacterized protein n=1 Tax=Colletotrichum tamarilloi TaxID=1209934 RepID=A0ABQ9R7X2_9PEZI|nr:uncharacterized protein CTAM01_07875 [Colletotrichum tamarilloi]KAK1497211.1 hypothetical protein CTAM01_07875 [Colletotrichum tamarilloi]